MCLLYSYDVILGKNWHSIFKPDICYRENLIKFHNGGRKVTFNPTLKKCNQLISANYLMQDVRKKHPVFAVMLRLQEKKIPVNSIYSSIPSKIIEILDEYIDVFPNELYSGLSPERSQDSKIELEPGSNPQKKGLYRLSQRELDELQKQLDDLLRKGFIRPISGTWVRQSFSRERKMVYATLHRLSCT